MECDRLLSERQAWTKVYSVFTQATCRPLIIDLIWHDPLKVWKDLLCLVRRIQNDSSVLVWIWIFGKIETHTQEWVSGVSLAFCPHASKSDCTHGHHCWLKTKRSLCVCVWRFVLTRSAPYTTQSVSEIGSDCACLCLCVDVNRSLCWKKIKKDSQVLKQIRAECASGAACDFTLICWQM